MRYYTPSEYLTLEEQSPERNEYRNREIITLKGGTTNHHEIVTNIYVYLKPLLRNVIHTKTVENRWILSEYEEPETILELTSLSLSIALQEIYTGIDFNIEDED